MSKSKKTPLPEGMVVSEQFRMPFFKRIRMLRNIPKRVQLMILIVFLMLVVASLFLILRQSNNHEEASVDDEEKAYTISHTEYAQKKIMAMRDREPDANAPSQDKEEYYSQLIGYYFTVKDYKSVTDIYKKIPEEIKNKLSPDTYLYSGISFYHLNDKETAQTLFDLTVDSARMIRNEEDFVQPYIDMINDTKNKG